MARWSNATLVALGGFDKNVIIDELLWGEDNYYDITYLADTQRTTQGFNGSIVTFTNGDNSVFQQYNYVSFGNSSELYEILSLTDHTLTLDRAPAITVPSGSSIQSPINLTEAQFQFRLLEHTATITDDTRAGVDIGDITPKVGATIINLDSNVLLDVPGKSLTLGQIRVIIQGSDLQDSPIIDTSQPPLYTGYVGVTLPGPDGVTPSQVKKQRICFILRADGTNS